MTLEEHRALCTVSFPEAGPGAIIRFRTADLVHLSTIFGTVAGEPWWQTVARRLRTPEPKAIQDALAAGLKNGQGGGTLEQLDWSDLPFPLEAAVEPLISAIGRALYGRRYVEAMQGQVGDSTAPAAGAP